MEKKTHIPEETEQVNKSKIAPEKAENEFDADNEVHKPSPDLIQKEDHHLPIDDEVKKG